jgi:hypothetical protein
MKLDEIKVGQKVVINHGGQVYTVEAVRGFIAYVTYRLNNGAQSHGRWIDVCYLTAHHEKQGRP